MTVNNNFRLAPMPRSLETQDGNYQFPDQALIIIDAPDPRKIYFSAQSLQGFLFDQLGLNWEIVGGKSVPEGQIGIVLSLVPGSMPHPQGYSLTITENRVFCVAAEPQGIFYAVQTIQQLITSKGRKLPTLRITDWPDFPNRGVMLDVSRDKVPSMDTLFELVDLLASWKINQLQLYTEHTFAYRNHPVVWQGASPITGEQILTLDSYCRERFVELVPNQNTFGHMHRWLVHEEYRHLSECPEGFDSEWGHFDEPFSLNPGDPGSFELIKDLFDALLPHFSSQQFNVGCDETIDLGLGHSKAIVQEKGAGRVYLDFLMKIYREVKARGLTMQFWGDILMSHPELVPELPRDVIVLEWGYQADHPFDQHGEMIAKSGIPFYVCPGTSSWNTVGGRTQNAIDNLRNAAENGLKHGAIGYLITDWGDRGHWQPLPVSYLGFAYGTGVSWGLDANRELDMSTILDLYAFQDEAHLAGNVAMDLGRVHERLNMLLPNSTILFHLLQSSLEEIAQYKDELPARTEELKQVVQQIEEIEAHLNDLKIQRSDAALLKGEFAWICGMLKHACWRGIWAAGKLTGKEDQVLREQLFEDAGLLMKEHENIWLARNRPGGLKDSLARLKKMRESYR